MRVAKDAKGAFVQSPIASIAGVAGVASGARITCPMCVRYGAFFISLPP